ncbi:hypothetical protein FB567DRAFT_620591 [Paraphoma chrysanthemicola]|uniref:F-box domain-containing protein n=1 Tax=Paraphoma chrysanthemicola TaxID=798071 RepID=A0A8K0R6W1_9PLEO|nr:hypothetical protein FB567DRAFT_620591 [Paraphoma chrysanthemicola]
MLRLLAPKKVNSERTSVETYEPTRPTFVNVAGTRQSNTATLAAPLAQKAKVRPGTKSDITDRPPTSNTSWDVPHLTKTPWELERNKKHSSWRKSKAEEPSFPAHFFERLPKEVYECIVTQLDHIHLRHDHACPSCYLRDLYNLSLVSRTWDKATTTPMYRKILLLANAEHAKAPKLKIKGTGRLKLLRRTLRERAALARCVRELHIPDFRALYENATIEREEIVNLIASLVMACPFLERVTGFHLPYLHTFDRLSQALSKRTNLRERVWLLADQETDLSDADDEEPGSYYLAACDPTERFLELNAKHPLLTTLVIHQSSQRTSTPLNFRSIVGTLRQFPALQNLAISGLSTSSFTNMVLNSLPCGLRSLRLENLPGINDTGIQRFATSRLASSIEVLTLINLEISSLVTISNILSAHLSCLRYFSLAQQRAPSLSSRNSMSNLDLSSLKLQHIHWEIRSEAGPLSTLPSSASVDIPEEASFPFANTEPICCLATALLAESIKEGAFPSLRRIRVPHDPQGIIQALCKPLATALLPSDTATLASPAYDPPLLKQNAPFGVPMSQRADSAINSPTSSTIFSQSALTPARSRLAAQSRILAARKDSLMTVRVFDPNGNLQINKVIRGFVGDVRSQITYELRADRGRTLGGFSDEASDRNEWITNIEDLAGDMQAGGQDLRAQSWSSCGHSVSARTGMKSILVDELF